MDSGRFRKSSGFNNRKACADEAIDDVLISSYEHPIASVELPDADDRHVLAAAVKGRADVIVTKNLKDFPAAELAKYDIEAQHADVFITHVLNLDTPIALGAIRRGRESLKNPPKSIEDYLDSLAAQELPAAVAFLRRWQPLL